MLLPHNKVSGGVQDSQIMIPSFFDRFYVMPPLTNGVHYKIILKICQIQHYIMLHYCETLYLNWKRMIQMLLLLGLIF